MKHLDQLHQKLRFPPKMNGNSETVTLPCAFVNRLILMAQAVEAHHSHEFEEELTWADDHAKAILDSGVQIHPR